MGGWTLVEDLVASQPDEAARVVEALPAEVAGALLDESPPAVAALVMSRLEPSSAAAALAACAPDRGGAILERLPFEHATALLRRLEAGLRDALLERLASDVAAPFRQALAFPAETAGALMDPTVVTLPEDLTVREARRHLRRHAEQAQDDVWIVSRDGVFVGAIALRVLVLVDGPAALRDLVDRNVGRIGPMAGRAAVLAHPAWSDRSALPVVDAAGRLLGAIPAATRRRLRGLPTPTGAVAAGPIAAGLAVSELYWLTASRLLGAILSAPEPGAEEPR